MKFSDLLRESTVGSWQVIIKKAQKGDCPKIIDGIKKDLDANKLNKKEFELLMALVDKKKATMNESIIQEKDSRIDTPEDLLIKNNFKIKSKHGTKFGTEFVMAKKYNEDEIKELLKDFSVKFDGNSIFVID